MINLNISEEVFNEVYFPYLQDYTNRFEVYYGGAGSGKSHFIAQKLLCKSLFSKRTVLIIRKVQASQRDSCWNLVLSILNEWNIKSLCKVSLSVMEIVLPNGSRLLFKGLDDPEKIKSIAAITDCWIEEATELTKEDFDQLNLRLRAPVSNLQIFISFNPISKANWVFKRWFSESSENKDTFILKTTYRDNKFLPKEYIKSLEDMIQTNPVYYKIYALGDFCSLDKLVYNNWKVIDFDLSEKNELQLCVGLDFGFVNDPTALIASLVDEQNKEIWIFDEAYVRGLTNDKIAYMIESHKFKKSIIIADSAEQKSIEEIRKLGIEKIKPSVKGQDSVRMGIQYLSQYKIYVNPICKNTIEELENYSFKKDKQTGEYTNEPLDEYNHLLDALRYSIQIVWKPNKLKTLDKSILGL